MTSGMPVASTLSRIRAVASLPGSELAAWLCAIMLCSCCTACLKVGLRSGSKSWHALPRACRYRAHIMQCPCNICVEMSAHNCLCLCGDTKQLHTKCRALVFKTEHWQRSGVEQMPNCKQEAMTIATVWKYVINSQSHLRSPPQQKHLQAAQGGACRHPSNIQYSICTAYASNNTDR